MKKKPKNKIATACANVMFFFDQDCSLSSALWNVTKKERDRIYKALKKGGLISPDELTDHEGNVRDVAFAAGYFLGTGQLVMNGQAQKALRVLRQAWLKEIDMPDGLRG